MMKPFTLATFAAFALISSIPVPGFAQDREGRIESTVNRIETRRRLQQYKIEGQTEQPRVAPVVPVSPATPSHPGSTPRARVSTKALPTVREVDPSIHSSSRRAKARSEPPTTIRTVSPRRSLPRD
jgi:hypothetical protein